MNPKMTYHYQGFCAYLDDNKDVDKSNYGITPVNGKEFNIKNKGVVVECTYCGSFNIFEQYGDDDEEYNTHNGYVNKHGNYFCHIACAREYEFPSPNSPYASIWPRMTDYAI